ncbi:MAG: GntR family transcriptional regulator [Lachnospiraceae bacterium]|nr:GntR family transcriptional regulator [Lachnospiraceae bacterium]
MPWNLNTDRPIYLQLVDIISFRIISGIYSAGTKLPSVRDLASEASVNPNTMQKALAELESTGLIFANRTSGRFVTEDNSLIRDAKRKLAKEYSEEIITKLRELGLSNEEIKATIADILDN